MLVLSTCPDAFSEDILCLLFVVVVSILVTMSCIKHRGMLRHWDKAHYFNIKTTMFSFNMLVRCFKYGIYMFIITTVVVFIGYMSGVKVANYYVKINIVV